MSAPGSNAAQGSATTVKTTYFKTYAAGDNSVFKKICEQHSQVTNKIVVAGASGQGVEVHVARELDLDGATKSMMKNRLSETEDNFNRQKKLTETVQAKLGDTQATLRKTQGDLETQSGKRALAENDLNEANKKKQRLEERVTTVEDCVNSFLGKLSAVKKSFVALVDENDDTRQERDAVLEKFHAMERDGNNVLFGDDNRGLERSSAEIPHGDADLPEIPQGDADLPEDV
ncbi:MAG: hypothetical protein SGARI_003091 [Bacillariaceae sp.]